jgi:hypothetical protein
MISRQCVGRMEMKNIVNIIANLRNTSPKKELITHTYLDRQHIKFGNERQESRPHPDQSHSL